MPETSTAEHKLDWSRVTPDNSEYTLEEQQRYQEVVGRALASSEVFRNQAAELGIEVSEDTTQILFILLAEVMYDLLAVSSIDSAPYVVPIPNLGDKKIAAHLHENDKHFILYNTQKLAQAAKILEEVLNADGNEVKLSGDELASTIYAVAHEMAHLRQDEKLPYFENRTAQEHNTGDWEHTTTNLMNYSNDLAETNAHAVAIRYVKAKKQARQLSPLWKVLDFSRVIGKEIESQGRYQVLANAFNIQDILAQRDKAVDAEEYARLQKKAEAIVRKLKGWDEKLERTHQRLGSVRPEEPKIEDKVSS